MNEALSGCAVRAELQREKIREEANALEEQIQEIKRGIIGLRTENDSLRIENARLRQAKPPAAHLLKLLADAKRMAEFGDINEDMDDDGIGWKAVQWYLDVSRVLKDTGHG